MGYSEQQVLQRIQQGDESAFGSLYSHYRDPALRFCISIVKDKEEAENILHDVFVKLWHRRTSINPDLNFSSYLFTSIKNKVFDYLKEVKKNESMKQNLWEQMQALQEEDAEEVTQEKHAKVVQAIENLSASRKMIVKMNIEEGMSYAEIAEQLNISKNTVKNQLVKAKQIIRKQFNPELSIPSST